jgi:NAD(P)-dependent dehydrogenase (short-subunit alcohol dehydrogenase family)
MKIPNSFEPEKNCLQNKIILITGAGDGIGRVAAKTFAEYGASIILVGRTLKKLEAVYDEIENLGGSQPAIYPADFQTSGKEFFTNMCNALDQEFGKLDGILHNAADLGERTPISNYSSDVWSRLMQVNVTAPFMLTQALLPLLMRAENASVLFTGSSVGYKGRAYWGAYAASKAAGENLMQTLADELEEISNVRVNSINPGATRTNMRAAAFPAEDPATLKSPEKLMRDYLFLLSDASMGINGQQIQASEAP